MLPGLIATMQGIGAAAGGGAAEWTLVGSTTSQHSTGETGNKSHTLPGTPATDDIVIALGTSDDTIDATQGGEFVTTGYTTLAQPTGAGVPGVHLVYKVMGGTPDTTIETSQPSVRHVAIVIQVWRGVNTGTPIDAPIEEASGGAATGMPDPPSYTTVTANALRIIVGGIDDDPVTPTAPSGYSNLEFKVITGSGTGTTAMIASKEAGAAGAEDPAAFGGTNDKAWRAYHFALRPA